MPFDELFGLVPADTDRNDACGRNNDVRPLLARSGTLPGSRWSASDSFELLPLWLARHRFKGAIEMAVPNGARHGQQIPGTTCLTQLSASRVGMVRRDRQR